MGNARKIKHEKKRLFIDEFVSINRHITAITLLPYLSEDLIVMTY